MANFRSIYKVQVLLTILVHLTLALYEDQVGKFDWKRSLVGKVKYVSFEAKRIIVATEENVLASLNLKNGNIQWRQILENPSQYQFQLLYVSKEIVTVSGAKNTYLVRSWDIQTGALIKEWSLNSERTTDPSFAVLNNKLLHIVPVASSTLEVTSYQLSGTQGGAKGSTRQISAPWIRASSECVVANSYYVCLAAGQLHYVDLSQNDANFIFKPVNDILTNEAAKTLLVEYNDVVPSVLLVRNNFAKLVSFTDQQVLIKSFDLMPNAVTIQEDGKASIYQLEANHNKDKLIRVRIKDKKTGADLFHTDLEYPLGLGAPVILGGHTNGAVTDLLLSTTDHALLLLRLPEGKIIWTREEALSNIVAAEFFELPVSELDASIEHEFESSDIFSMFVHRITTQANQLSSLVLGSPSRAKNDLVRDEFGLHKIIVVATKAGKLFAIDTMSGSVAWSYRLPNVKSLENLGKENMVLFVQRTAQYAPLPAHCTLLAKDAVTGNGIIFEFDPITGYSSKGLQRLSYQIVQAMLLPQVDKNYLKPILILSENQKTYLYPPEAKSVVKDHLSTTYMFTVDTKQNILKGYNFRHSAENEIQSTVVWDLALSPSTIVSVSAINPNERVHSQGKVLYDRSVYYKYVNPNLLAVATVSNDPVHRTVLSIYLIDGVTGLVLYSTSHKKCKGPVYLVHSENWLVYSYFNDRSRRMEVSAVELYEGVVQSNSTVFSSFATSQLPDIQTQSYILPAHPVSMAVTLTERGITNKFLLVALSNGAVVEIPWLLLQPRFGDMPCGPEESCIPYMPEIPLPSEAIINYNQTLGRIRNIKVAPARLESTSHILVHGLDMFYTRVAPSKTFDVLKEDFDHRLIVLVLAGLIVASFVTKHLAARKALKQAWK